MEVMDVRSDRLSQMEQYVLENRHVSLVEICQRYGISINTARRDIKELLKSGSIIKVYGGVSAADRTNAVPFEVRNEKGDYEKRGIAALATAYIKENDIVFIDSGTTTQYILDYVPEDLSFTVITYSIKVLFAAAARPNIRLVVLPGEFYRETNSFCGTDAQKILETYSIHTAFMAATTVSREGLVGNSFAPEYEIKRTAVARSYKKVLLIDSTKYGKVSLRAYATLKDFDQVFTGQTVEQEFCELCEANQVEVLQKA
ncbi:MAG: DeoR/GlpR family DNA-binding transcription regulator [Oscillospiraceae bacterium]